MIGHRDSEACGQAVTPKATPFRSLQAAGESVAQLVARLEGLSEKLVGAVPQNPREGTTKLSQGGLLPSMQDAAEQTCEIVQRGNEAIARIERMLP